MPELSIGILATGSHLPKEEVGNEELAARSGTTPEWIERKTRIHSRRFAAPDEAASDLGARAAERALEQAGMTADELDYIIVSTSTGDQPCPPTSTVVQDLLGARKAACFDLNVVCAGFVYGLALARGLVTLHPSARVLVLAAEVYSRILDFSDRRTSVLFADGAAAAIVGRVPEPYGFLDVELASRGEGHQLIGVPAGGSRRPASHETVAAGEHYFRMEGRAVSEFVMEAVPPHLERLTTRAGVALDDVHHFVPHQGNGVLLERLARRLGLTEARTHVTVDRYGNVGSASIPVTLDDAHRSGRIGRGDLVLISGFGGGLSLGSCLLRWAVAP